MLGLLDLPFIYVTISLGNAQNNHELEQKESLIVEHSTQGPTSVSYSRMAQPKDFSKVEMGAL
jgi:hypothetical protein